MSTTRKRKLKLISADSRKRYINYLCKRWGHVVVHDLEAASTSDLEYLYLKWKRM